MYKLISLVATLFVSTVAMAADSSAPVPEGAIPSATCGLARLGRRGHRIYVGPRHALLQQRPKKQYDFKLRAFRSWTSVPRGLTPG